jgi:hypothetical protein
MKPGEEWRWDGRCVCCGCDVVFSVEKQDTSERLWWVTMAHFGKDRDGRRYTRFAIEDEAMHDGGATLKAVIKATTERLYADGLC